MAREFDFDRDEFDDLENECEVADLISRDFISQCMKNESFFVVPSRVIWKLWDKLLKGDVK